MMAINICGDRQSGRTEQALWALEKSLRHPMDYALYVSSNALAKAKTEALADSLQINKRVVFAAPHEIDSMLGYGFVAIACDDIGHWGNADYGKARMALLPCLDTMRGVFVEVELEDAGGE